MDLAYLRAHPDQLPTFLTHQRIRETPVHGGSISAASRLTLDDGNSLFAKQWPDDSTRTAPGPRHHRRPAGFFAAEARGIEWLRVEGGATVPSVLTATDELIALEWIDEAHPAPDAARAFGAALARTHAAGAGTFGAPWPGYIGNLPLDNAETGQPWSRWFGERRLRPYLEMSLRNGALNRADAADVERLIVDIAHYAGPADSEPPARIHGDLWPGNLLWSASGVVMIDPAAHGGHRETDLATLYLFGGAPHLDEILAGYRREHPLADGFERRVPLHQLHLLLVHTAMFGTGYRDAVMGAVRATVDS